MCGIVGLINYKRDLYEERNLFKKMSKTLSLRGPDEEGFIFRKHFLLGHKRLVVVDRENGKQPMEYNGLKIVYNGEIYNTSEIRKELINEGYSFNGYSDTEVILKGYDFYKEKIVNHLNGIFAFVIEDRKKFFLARDRVGVKPLFYAKKNNYFIFGSEIKTILKSKKIKPIINKRSLQELLGLGPSRTPGCGIFKDIHEIKPGHYMIYKKGRMKIKKYWDVKNKKFNGDFENALFETKNLLIGAIKRQMVSDVPLATFLSGGVDSSIITAVMSEDMENNNKELTSYSIDYKDNKKYFVKNNYQVDEDNKYINKMILKYDLDHHYKVISQEDLAVSLKESLIARDYPGMADIDGSLLWFCKEVKQKHTVCLSGECADEIFGGYPWFYREELLNKKGFPWIQNLEKREKLLNDYLRYKLNLKSYVLRAYWKTILRMPLTFRERKMKKLFYLNLKWFMPTLLERKDRMSMRASLEVRVPFSDHYLIDYLWNVPYKFKYMDGIPKGLLREGFKSELPKEIYTRAKNPYPKTHNPLYTDLVINLLKDRIDNPYCRLFEIFNRKEVLKLIESKGSSFKIPWFGQLMTGPQLIAYLYQFDLWLEEYDIILKI